MIISFDGPHRFLSNFYPVKVTFEGMEFPTVEHSYQSAKCTSLQERIVIQIAATPGKAKRLGHKVTMCQNWDAIRVDVMRSLLVQKFSNPSLKDMLLNTGEQQLIEGNAWGDKFWGAVLENGRWVGQNKLGNLLMQIRNELRARTQNAADLASPSSSLRATPNF